MFSFWAIKAICVCFFALQKITTLITINSLKLVTMVKFDDDIPTYGESPLVFIRILSPLFISIACVCVSCSHTMTTPSDVILGKQCLHVLSKGTALHKAVGCWGCLCSFSLFKQCAAVKAVEVVEIKSWTHKLKLCDSVLDCSWVGKLQLSIAA